MKSSSLSLRLILLACVSIFLALGATGLFLNKTFYNYFEERIYTELDQYLKQVTARIVINPDNSISVQPLPDPRFALPFSGLYWQVTEAGQDPVLSRSLWGKTIDLPPNPVPGEEVRGSVTADNGVPLLALGWTILLGDEDNRRVLSLTVAVDKSEVVKAAAGFRLAFLQWLSLMFLALIIASWFQVRLGLAPLEAIRKKVEQVRSGARDRLEGRFPKEVRPLVLEVNELLDLHQKSLTSARARASDLAHGLKTPLAVMLALARDLRAKGDEATAKDIEDQVESMRHYIERELARVRTKTPAGHGAKAAPVVAKMVSAIERFPRETPLEWQVDVSDTLVTPFDEHDLSEMLGNTLDNARKWAKSLVRITGGHSNGSDFLRIEDDGPGVSEDLFEAILERGEKLDPSVQGQGLGLAICADMAAAYGAEFTLGRAETGGLMVEIRWNGENPANEAAE